MATDRNWETFPSKISLAADDAALVQNALGSAEQVDGRNIFAARPDGTAYVEVAGIKRVFVDAAGNAGIGTSSPSIGLDVATTGYIWVGPKAALPGWGGNLRLRDDTGTLRWLQGLLGSTGETSWSLFDIVAGIARLQVNSSGHVTPGADNVQTLGSASLRWSVVYAGTGTINTSDEREKAWRGPLDADELRAARRIVDEIGIYQWLDAIAEKGEAARLHCGVRAQRAFAIMTEQGLNWRRYAWCCFDEWDEVTEPVVDENGKPTGETRVVREAGDRYGIRPDQLAFWLIAAQAQVQASLEARLAALEAAA